MISGFTLSNGYIDQFIDPELSKLTECNLPELPLWENFTYVWIRKFSYIVRVPPQDYAFFLRYICRVEHAAAEYNFGREALSNFLPIRNRRPERYLKVLHHFEQCIALIYQGHCLSRTHIEDKSGDNILKFVKNDGSVTERISIIYNDSKHSDERILNGKLPENGIGPIWLTNLGINSVNAYLSFSELYAFLKVHVETVKWLTEDFLIGTLKGSHLESPTGDAP